MTFSLKVADWVVYERNCSLANLCCARAALLATKGMGSGFGNVGLSMTSSFSSRFSAADSHSAVVAINMKSPDVLKCWQVLYA